MAKKIQLSIADPCHENWDNMTRAEQGRFCASCQKQVVDFSGMSDRQVLAFFRKPSTGSVCGRFYNDQLDRDIEIPRKRIPWLKYFFQFALPAFLASAKATAQGNVVIKRPDVTVTPIETRVKLGEVSIPQNVIDIKGKVTDKNNAPVPYASVVIKGTKNGVMADSAGAFKLSHSVQDDFTLQVSCAGFQPAEMAITKKTDFTNDVIIQLGWVTLDEVVVVAYPSYRVGRVTTGAVSMITRATKEIPPVQSPEKPAMIKVYPNPVLAGTSINVGCEKLEEGYYTFQLFSQAGQQVQHKQIWIDAEATIMNMEIPSVAAGVYFLRLTNKESRKRFSVKVIVQ
ncbi:MAG TPA: carboxypeptidase-like regulatory domain-containing protein [Chitinophagaceae bacterium]